MYVSLNGGAYTKIAELRDVTLTVERDVIDVSSHSSSGWKDNILGLAQWSASAEALYVHSDAKQDSLYNALVDPDNNVLTFRFVPEGSVGVVGTHEKWEGQGIITSWELASPNDNASAVSISILGVGALVKAALASGDNPA